MDKFVLQLQEQVEERSVTIEVTPAAHDWLAEHGYKPEFGAREMGRMIHQHIKRPLADMMLFGDLQQGGTAIIDVADDELVVRVKTEKSPPEPEPAEERELVDA